MVRCGPITAFYRMSAAPGAPPTAVRRWWVWLGALLRLAFTLVVAVPHVAMWGLFVRFLIWTPPVDSYHKYWVGIYLLAVACYIVGGYVLKDIDKDDTITARYPFFSSLSVRWLLYSWAPLTLPGVLAGLLCVFVGQWLWSATCGVRRDMVRLAYWIRCGG